MANLDDKILKAYLLGSKDKETIEAVFAWIKESEENAATLFRLEELYSIGKYREPDNKEIEASYKDLKIRLDKTGQKHISPLIITLLKFAATIVLVLSISLSGYYYFSTHETLLVASTGNTVKVISLSDGSKVWLNKNTTFKYPKIFKGSSRKVCLDGEAYFEVSANIEHPFIVSSKGMDVRAVGTEFNFNTTANVNTEEVTLLEGKLIATGKMDEGKIMILPYQKAVLDKTARLITVESIHTGEDVIWQDKPIPLNNAKLTDITRILEKAYGVSITISPEVDANTSYSGYIKKGENIASVLDALSYSIPMSYRISGKKIIITSSK